MQYIYGLHAAKSLLSSQPQQVKQVLLDKNRKDSKIEEINQLTQQQGCNLQLVGKEELDRLSHDGNHQGVVIACNNPPQYNENDLFTMLENLEEPALLLFIDGVQDPHNLGACLRSANAAGAHAVIIPKDKAAGITPVVRKVACGAAENTPVIRVTNLARCMKKAQEMGIWLYGTSDRAKSSIYAYDYTGSIGIVVGSEDAGIRQLTEKHCDYLLQIPMQGTVPCLNVSVATGVILFEALRQRLEGKIDD